MGSMVAQASERIAIMPPPPRGAFCFPVIYGRVVDEFIVFEGVSSYGLDASVLCFGKGDNLRFGVYIDEIL